MPQLDGGKVGQICRGVVWLAGAGHVRFGELQQQVQRLEEAVKDLKSQLGRTGARLWPEPLALLCLDCLIKSAMQ